MTISIDVFDKAKHPALKMFLSEEDITTAVTSWFDRITDLEVNAQVDFTRYADGVLGGADGIAPVSAGALPVIGGGHPLLLVAGTIAAAGNYITIGSAGGTGIELKIGNDPYVALDANNYLAGANLEAPAAYPLEGAFGMFVDKSNNDLYRVAASRDGSYFTTAKKAVSGNVGSIAGTWPPLTVGMKLLGSGLGRGRMYLLYVFATPPSLADIDAAIKWLAENPTILPPVFEGKL